MLFILEPGVIDAVTLSRRSGELFRLENLVNQNAGVGSDWVKAY